MRPRTLGSRLWPRRSTNSRPIWAARVDTRSVSERTPLSISTRPRDRRERDCSSRAACSWSWVRRPLSRRSVPSWLPSAISLVAVSVRATDDYTTTTTASCRLRRRWLLFRLGSLANARPSPGSALAGSGSDVGEELQQEAPIDGLPVFVGGRAEDRFALLRRGRLSGGFDGLGHGGAQAGELPGQRLPLG